MNTTNELTMEEQMEYWENEIAFFGKYLTAEGQLKADTIDKHVNSLRFVTTIYFVRYGLDYEQLQGETIVDFLGYFYISKMLSSSKSDIINYIPAFKKWTQYLLQTGKISVLQGAEIVEVCKHKEFFVDRLDQYMKAKSDRAMEKWLYSNDIDAYLSRQKPKSAAARVKPKPIMVDTNLLELWMDDQTAVPQIVTDFQKFLAAVQEAKSIKVTTARQHLPRKFWKELDEKLQWNLFRKPTLNQDQEPLFQFFFYAAEALGLISENKQQCVVTNQAEQFLALSDKEQAAVLLDSLWNKVAWENLQESNEGGYPEAIQASREAIAGVLVGWPVGKLQNVRIEWMHNRHYGKLLDMSVDVFLHAVVSVLMRFDLVSAQYLPESEMKYAFERKPVVMAVKEPGMRVFSYFANEDVQLTTKTVSIQSKIGRNDPCLCGSGKKYKKCCL